MKDLQTIQREIDQLSQTDFQSLKRGQAKRILQQIQFLKTCHVYIGTGPDREFLVRERRRVQTLIEGLAKGFNGDYIGRNPDPRKWKAEYETEVGMKKHRAHLRTLRYLLG